MSNQNQSRAETSDAAGLSANTLPVARLVASSISRNAFNYTPPIYYPYPGALVSLPPSVLYYGNVPFAPMPLALQPSAVTNFPTRHPFPDPASRADTKTEKEKEKKEKKKKKRKFEDFSLESQPDATQFTTATNHASSFPKEPVPQQEYSESSFSAGGYPGPLKWIVYDVNHFEKSPTANAAMEAPKKRPRYDSPASASAPLTKEEHPPSIETEPQFKCAGCKKEYFQIADHFQRLRVLSPCAEQVFHLRLAGGDGGRQWGEAISYRDWVMENFTGPSVV